jgi:hypothetical protein
MPRVQNVSLRTIRRLTQSRRLGQTHGRFDYSADAFRPATKGSPPATVAGIFERISRLTIMGAKPSNARKRI